MNSLVKVVPNVKKYSDYLFNIKKGTNPLMLSGLTDSAKVHMAYATKFYSDKPICIITYNEMQAKRIMKDMEFFDEKVEFFPKRDITSFDYIAESKDSLYKRISILNDIKQKKVGIIVTTIEAAMQRMIRKEVLYKKVFKIKVGETVDLEKLKETLVALGYERYDLIEGKGQFSVRGGIIDIATSQQHGVRIEFWGDEVDSIRRFRIESQRSTTMLDEIEIYPAFEFILEKDINTVCDKILKNNYIKVVRENVEQDVEMMRSGEFITKIDKYFDEFYSGSDLLIDYLSEDCIIFLDEIEKIKARTENLRRDNEHLVKDLIDRNKFVPEILKTQTEYSQFVEQVVNKQTVYLEKQDIGFVDKQSMHAKRNGYSFSYREVNFFRSSMDLLFEELQKAQSSGKITVVLGGSTENTKKMKNLFLENNINCTYIEDLNLDEELASGNVFITPGAFSAGFESFDLNLLVITLDEFFENKKKKKRNLSEAFKNGETVVFSDLKIGDYVVHSLHGIAQYIGVNTIKADGVTKDYIKLKYKGDDILYIPTNSLDNVRKFIGGGSGVPKVNKLGSKDWDKEKAKVKNNLREVAEELIRLYAIRSKAKGFSFSPDTPWQKEFEDNFLYVETDDQLRCIAEVKKDMENSKPMDRLLCGDVGYGKTEVAIRAAFKSCMDQKQVAYLVPTTVLAQQQYESFAERMKDYPIRVEVLNRFKTPKQQKEVLKKLELGQVDILVGTHRILSKDIQFKDLGLLIIDEEHRFGVKAKEKIKELKNNVDVLTMTATPIPRTLHMSIVGMRDMSVIYEPPQDRKPVQTYVLEYDEEVIREAITKELERNGQVYYLYNNVEGIVSKVNQIEKLVPEAKVGFAHGKMTGNEIEEIMEQFVEQKINVLVCTTILESGIDIPNANTIIVENADKLGLAQLYQIRGRVGRSNKQAYSFITYRRDKLLSEVADKRLKAIKEFTEFGSGFKIAMRDLEIRGAGSVMGEFQHGHMENVGYDMYCKLLDQVVKELKGEEIVEESDIQIDLNISSYIPDEFIQESSQKIEIYQNIALCKTDKDIEDVVDEIIDRYGQFPKEIGNLLEIAKIKNIARDKSVIKLTQKGNNIVYHFNSNKFNFNIVDKLIKIYRSRIKFSAGNLPYITFQLSEKYGIIEQCKEFLNNL
ncbi:MAG: transcription-repair coupling factor [Clostridia bacterium]|nr:transcription-repair coupling factor [Clostridia bacterium]